MIWDKIDLILFYLFSVEMWRIDCPFWFWYLYFSITSLYRYFSDLCVVFAFKMRVKWYKNFMMFFHIISPLYTLGCRVLVLCNHSLLFDAMANKIKINSISTGNEWSYSDCVFINFTIVDTTYQIQFYSWRNGTFDRKIVMYNINTGDIVWSIWRYYEEVWEIIQPLLYYPKLDNIRRGKNGHSLRFY